MTTLKELYGSWTDLTLTLASLATDATLLAGRASTALSRSWNPNFASSRRKGIRVQGHLTERTASSGP